MAKDDHYDLISTGPMNPSEAERQEAEVRMVGREPLWTCPHCRRENPFPYGECMYCHRHEDGKTPYREASPLPRWRCNTCHTDNQGWHCRTCGKEKPEREPGVGSAKDDLVNRPRHYASFEIEPVEFVSRNGLDFLRGNAIKYLCRAFLKGGAEDLKKALRYVQMALEHHYGVHVPINWDGEREVEGLNWNLKGGKK
jgi:hypothetical protein